MFKDFQGLEISTTTAKTPQRVDKYIDQVLFYGDIKDWGNAILPAVESDPKCALVKVLAADYHIALEQADAAKTLLTEARKISNEGHTTDRETRYINAWEYWLGGRMEDALVVFESIAKDYPTDLFAVKRGQLMAFFLGLSDRLLSIVQSVSTECSHRQYYHGMLSFALEQNGKIKESEGAAREGMKVSEKDPWAHHAIAHSLFFQGRCTEGIEFLTKMSHHWNSCCSFMKTHNWWHLALFQLELDHFEDVFTLFDGNIWGCHKDGTQDQIGALSMLWKLQMKGISRDVLQERWDDVMEYAVKRVGKHWDLFYDLLLVRGLCVHDHHSEFLHKMLSSMKHHVTTVTESRQKDLSEVWLSCAQAIAAMYSSNDPQAAYDLLRPIMSRLDVVGGSNEQLLVFHEMFQDILQQLNKHSEAKDYYNISHPHPDPC